MKQCEICGKGTMMVGRRVKLRGHYNPTVKKRKYPNLQKAALPSGKKGLVCTKCLKKLTAPPSLKLRRARSRAVV